MRVEVQYERGVMGFGTKRVASVTLEGTEQVDWQLFEAQQCFRFCNGDLDFDEREIGILLRGLRNSECEARRAWFGAATATRRRPQRSTEDAPIAQVFAMPDEYELLERRAILAQIRRGLAARGLQQAGCTVCVVDPR